MKYYVFILNGTYMVTGDVRDDAILNFEYEGDHVVIAAVHQLSLSGKETDGIEVQMY